MGGFIGQYIVLCGEIEVILVVFFEGFNAQCFDLFDLRFVDCQIEVGHIQPFLPVFIVAPFKKRSLGDLCFNRLLINLEKQIHLVRHSHITFKSKYVFIVIL